MAYTRKLEGEVFLLRGIRNKEDAEYELAITQCITVAGGNCHFLFVTAPPELEEISSSSIKHLCESSDWEQVAKQVPFHVLERLKEVYYKRRQKWIVAQDVPASIFETTTAGFGPMPHETFPSSYEQKQQRDAESELTLISTSGHRIPMVDELEGILNKLDRSKVTIQFFGKMRDNFKQLEANGFIKFADFITAEQVRMMLDPCWMDVVSSETYDLKEIPLESVKPMGVRFVPCSQSLGPIIVDLKPKELIWADSLPPVVVIEGKHRWMDAQERGDEKIMAYVGNEAMKYFKDTNEN